MTTQLELAYEGRAGPFSACGKFSGRFSMLHRFWALQTGSKFMTMQIKFSKHNSPTVPYMVNRSRVLACDWLQEFALNFSVACRWTKCFGLIFPLLLHKWSKRLSVEMRFFSILYFWCLHETPLGNCASFSRQASFPRLITTWWRVN